MSPLPTRRTHPAPRLLVALSLVTGLAIVLLFLWRAFYAHRSQYFVGWVSGVWLGLARDLADGVFYRPIVGDAGYGGTRYMPLHFSLVAALIRMGLAPATAGLVTTVSAAVGLLTVVTVWTKRMGLPGAVAFLVGALTLAPYFVQETVFELRSDVLATALEVAGLACLFALPPGRAAPIGAAAACFVLAWLTKVTAEAGIVAAIAALSFQGSGASARRLTWVGAAGLLAATLALLVASHGRIWEAFRDSAAPSPGLIAILSALLVPGPTALVAGSVFLKLAFAVALIALLWDRRSILRDPAAWFLVVSAIDTMLLLTSPGTTLRNHIVEPYVATLLVVGTWMARAPGRHTAGVLVAISLAVVAMQHVVRDPSTAAIGRGATTIPVERRALLSAVDQFTAPVFSESAVYPVMAGRRPYVGDPFALRQVVSRRADVAADLASKLDHHFFRFVILEHDPNTPEGAGFYEGLHLGTAVLARIQANYTFTKTIAGARIYVPTTASR